MANELRGWEGRLKINGYLFYFQTLSGPTAETTTFRTDKAGDGGYQGITWDKSKLTISGMAQWRSADNPHTGDLGLYPGAELTVKFWPNYLELADDTKSYRMSAIVTKCGLGSLDAREGGQPFEISLESNGTFQVYGEANP